MTRERFKYWTEFFSHDSMLFWKLFPSGSSAVWLAHLLWEQGVEGSNPFAPTIGCKTVWPLKGSNAGIAQLARAMAFQAVGRGFEPRFPLFVMRL